MPVANEAADHVRPHPAEPDEPDLHSGPPVRRIFDCSASRAVNKPPRITRGGAPGRGPLRAAARSASGSVEVDTDDRQVVGLDRLEVALGLGVDQPAERVGPTGDRSVDRMVRRQLDEPASRRAALVELAGRVQEARPVAGGRGVAGRVAEEGPDAGDRGVAAGGRGDERLDRQVGVGAAAVEVRGGARPRASAHRRR